MQSINQKSPSKINLTLDILGKDISGYHFVDTIMHKIDLCDEIEIQKKDKGGFSMECNIASIVDDPKNTIKKAYDLLTTLISKELHLHVLLQKNIPMGAGLGGGSSNAAVFLKMCNELFELNLSQGDLVFLGKQVGMDVPFFLYDANTAYATHYGEKIEEIWNIPSLDMAILMPKDESISTKSAYAYLDLDTCGKDHSKTLDLLQMKKNGAQITKDVLMEYIHNDFEKEKQDGEFLTGSGAARYVFEAMKELQGHHCYKTKSYSGPHY